MSFTENKWIYFIFLFALSSIFIILFSLVSSPFIDFYLGDSSIFMILGNMFINGKIPYLDFFDHKGPIIVLIEAFGQLIVPYRMGVFILQLLYMFFVLIVIDKTSKLFFLDIRRTAIIFLFLMLLSRFYSGGNTVEEYSLLPLFLSLYIGMKCCLKDIRITAQDGFLLGLCFSYIFWLRMNNAGALCAITISLFVFAVLKKDVSSINNLIIYFVLGQLPFTISFCLYFIYHDALYDLFYSTFLYNFNYAGSFFTFATKRLWINLLLLVMLSLASFVYYKNHKSHKITLLSTLLFLFTFFAMNVGYVFKHYYILSVVPFVFASIILLSELKTEKLIKRSSCAIAILFLGICVGQSVSFYKKNQKEGVETAHFREEIKRITSPIPDNELDRLYYYNVNPIVYATMEQNPNYKYFAFQEWQGSFDKQIFDDINVMMRSDSFPIWVIIENKKNSVLNSFKNISFCEILQEKYDVYDTTEEYVLYKHH